VILMNTFVDEKLSPGVVDVVGLISPGGDV
jgi:hypothetical protein